MMYPGLIAFVCDAFNKTKLTFLSANNVIAVPANSKNDQKTVIK